MDYIRQYKLSLTHEELDAILDKINDKEICLLDDAQIKAVNEKMHLWYATNTDKVNNSGQDLFDYNKLMNKPFISLNTKDYVNDVIINNKGLLSKETVDRELSLLSNNIAIQIQDKIQPLTSDFVKSISGIELFNMVVQSEDNNNNLFYDYLNTIVTIFEEYMVYNMTVYYL